MEDVAVGAAEEERHDDGRHGDGVHELGQEEQAEADGRVLGVEAADQLRVRLGEVEGRPGQLGRDGDHEEDEGQEAESDEVPVPEAVDCDATMARVESEPVTSTTMTVVMPSAAS